MPNRLFASECDPVERTTATWSSSGELMVNHYSGMAHLGFELAKEDAISLARAILGIADPPILDWDAMVTDMRDEASTPTQTPDNSQDLAVALLALEMAVFPLADHPIPGFE